LCARALKTKRLKKYARAAGLVDTWRDKGWPDLFHPTTGDDFECNWHNNLSHWSLAGTSVRDAVDGSPPTTAAYAAAENRRRAMERVTTIGLDIAKSVFQVHGIDATGKVVLRRRLMRARVASFFAKLAPCLVGIEACATSHHWGRELRKLGHDVRLMPPS
jgi:hypothetical protein